MTLSPASGPTPSPARPGTILGGRYRLIEAIGRGGMGEVWKARDSQLEREVAAKLPTAHAFDEDARNRILREARLVASLNHPGIVAVHDAGVSEGQPFVIFELVPGRNLREQPRHDPESVRSIAEQVLEALEHVHANGIVHRDLKPENLLWADGETGTRIKIADLGIAFSGSATTLAAGSLVGTAAYLAPEQALGGAVDGRADLYALGAVLYELIADRPPFEGGDLLAIVSQHVHAPVPPLRLHVPDVDPGLERFVLRLLEKSPEERFSGAHEALDALRALAAGVNMGAIPPAAGAPIDQLVRGRLVGRGPELERLRTAWREALEGHARLVLLSGEPGVGKTRLARELVVAARVDGAVALAGGVLRVRGDDALPAVRRGAHVVGARPQLRVDARHPRRHRRGTGAAGARDRRPARAVSGRARAAAARGAAAALRGRDPVHAHACREARRCCSCSTTCTGPTPARSPWCDTCCASCAATASCSWAPTARSSSTAATRSPRRSWNGTASASRRACRSAGCRAPTAARSSPRCCGRRRSPRSSATRSTAKPRATPSSSRKWSRR